MLSSLGVRLGLGVASGSIIYCRSGFQPFSVDAKSPTSVHDFIVSDIDGNPVDLITYKGKVCVVVNVASKWGKTKVNYSQLETLYQQYGAEAGKLAVLAFPCNQFGNQEPGSNLEIKSFAAKQGATFDMFEKVEVNGDKAAPLWKFLKDKQGGLLSSEIKWNFTKFVINQEGQPVARLGPLTDPIPGAQVEIDKLL